MTNEERSKDSISRQDTFDLMRSLTKWSVLSVDGKFSNVGLLYDDVMFGIGALHPVGQQEHITRDKLDEITYWLQYNIFRNDRVMFDPSIRGDDDSYQDIDLIEVIASLHNMLYKAVTGQYYDYMFHWANKVGSWVYDDMFKPENEKRERI